MACSSLYLNLSSLVDVCYPRQELDYVWHNDFTTYHNLSLSSLGKKRLNGQINNAFYPSESFTIQLSLNLTEALDTLDQLIAEDWLNIGTQAVILECLLYSPNSYLVSAGAMLGEFSNFGSFVPSHDLVIVSEYYLTKNLHWTSIILILFFFGFFCEEIRDFKLSWKSSSIIEREEASTACNKYFSSLYLYLLSWWNVMDFFLISAGLIYVVLLYYTAQSLNSYTLDDIWLVAERKQIAEVLGSATILLAYFRILDYLTLWNFLGVLIITIFKMIADILRFLTVFIILVVGFSTAFHVSYTGTGVDTWNEFLTGTLSTFITTYTGYFVPYYDNVLVLAGPVFALIIQIIYVFVGLILLLNLLIALLWDTYAVMAEKALIEYRWLITKPFKSGFQILWPAPFTALHLFLLAICRGFNFCKVEDIREKNRKLKEDVSALPTNLQLLNYAMVSNFLKGELKDEFKNYIIHAKPIFRNIQEQ